mgnify:CR=1 FL=1
MEDGEGVENTIVARKVERGANLRDIGGKCMAGQHNAFWFSFAAGSEEDDGGVLGLAVLLELGEDVVELAGHEFE